MIPQCSPSAPALFVNAGPTGGETDDYARRGLCRDGLHMTTKSTSNKSKAIKPAKHAIYAQATLNGLEDGASIPSMADFSRLSRHLRPREQAKASDQPVISSIWTRTDVFTNTNRSRNLIIVDIVVHSRPQTWKMHCDIIPGDDVTFFTRGTNTFLLPANPVCCRLRYFPPSNNIHSLLYTIHILNNFTLYPFINS